MQEDLKPCPFCGSPARFKERKCDIAKYAIGCSDSLCIIWLPNNVRKRELHTYATCWAEKEDAINAWNRRN